MCLLQRDLREGDIITLQSVGQQSEKHFGGESVMVRAKNSIDSMQGCLLFAGGWAQDTEEYPLFKKPNNAIPNEEGVVRAMQRILSGEEILVEYDSLTRHPVQFLDCIFEGRKKEGMGKVTSFTGDERGEVIYTVTYTNGSVDKMNETELERKIGRKRKGVKRQKGKEEEKVGKEERKRSKIEERLKSEN